MGANNVFPWDVEVMVTDAQIVSGLIWGYQFKRMNPDVNSSPVAILCTDMDGLNLNAHGNQMQYLTAAANPIITSGPSNTSVVLVDWDSVLLK